MARSKSSGSWLKEHFDDEYVAMAQKDGYRSRAVYKLKELQQKDRLFKPGMLVIDLGAAPGAWSQYIAEEVGDKGEVIGLDILPMDTIPGVVSIQGDFREDEVFQKLLEIIGDRKVDAVVSDMAPNMSGHNGVDQPRAMYLVELAVEFAKETLKPGGDFVAKVFQGEGFQETMKELNQAFTKVYTRKPKASRPRSREVYYVARNRKID